MHPPDGKWLALDHGIGDRLKLDWHIHDHMGNGPSHQVYFDLMPLPDLLVNVRRIIDNHDETRER